MNLHLNAYLTIDEVAERMRVSTSTVRRLRDRGEGPVFILVGRNYRWRLGDVIAWEEAQREAAEKLRQLRSWH